MVGNFKKRKVKFYEARSRGIINERCIKNFCYLRGRVLYIVNILYSVDCMFFFFNIIFGKKSVVILSVI